MTSTLGPRESHAPPTGKSRIGVIAALAVVTIAPITAILVSMALGAARESRPVMEQHAHVHGEAVEWHDGLPAPDVRLHLAADPVAGWNLRVQADGFRFAPEQAGEAHVDGEGHAHLYIDGEKTARIYGPWIHLNELPDDAELISVTLNTNDHRNYVADGEPLHADVAAPSR
ncbi:MAG: hypothetical protein ACR2RA_11845 [Geminicoccaceae bacterium]